VIFNVVSSAAKILPRKLVPYRRRRYQNESPLSRKKYRPNRIARLRTKRHKVGATGLPVAKRPALAGRVVAPGRYLNSALTRPTEAGVTPSWGDTSTFQI
jgi:hypothetical protein